MCEVPVPPTQPSCPPGTIMHHKKIIVIVLEGQWQVNHILFLFRILRESVHLGWKHWHKDWTEKNRFAGQWGRGEKVRVGPWGNRESSKCQDECWGLAGYTGGVKKKTTYVQIWIRHRWSETTQTYPSPPGDLQAWATWWLGGLHRDTF